MELIILILAFLSAAFGYNLDTVHPITFHGTQKGSYFGFSLAYQLSDSHNTRILISAPKANSSVLKKAREPGVLFSCRYNGEDIGKCEEVVLDKTENSSKVDSHHSYRRYKDGRDNMWLGASLTSQTQYPWNALVCAHRWTNSFELRQNVKNIHMLGACYVLPPSHRENEIITLIPMLSTQIEKGYAALFGQSGIASTFSQDGSSIFIGNPGMFLQLGSVSTYKNLNRLSIEYPGSEISYTEGLGYFSKDIYTGYAVASGNFFSPELLCVALGGPRARFGFGKVYIGYNTRGGKKLLEAQDDLTGDQFGSYFGASLLAINLNKDNFTDLLVGAPLYSRLGDEGRVYVYHSNGIELGLAYHLEGTHSSVGSRFGTTMADAGDLNVDGYNEVAIGAPYEDNGMGAVYIYHGSPIGLKRTPAQRLSPLELGWPMRGFGRAIASSIDLDGNLFPDLLIGAYASDHAVILRSRAVVDIWGRLQFSVPQIDRDTKSGGCALRNEKVTCFSVIGCLTTSGKYLPEQMGIAMKIEIDPISDSRVVIGRRGNFLVNGTASYTVQKTLLVGDKEICVHETVYISDQANQDYVNPVIFNMTFELVDPVQSESSFCGHCPVTNPSLPNSVINMIPFSTGCGDDSVCKPELTIEAEIVNLEEGTELILGENRTFTLRVNMTNVGEPAYLAKWQLQMPGRLLLVRQMRHCNLQGKPGGDVEYEMICNLGNPLRTTRNPVNETVELDTTQLPNTEVAIYLNLEMKAIGQLINPEKAQIIITVPLKIVADITIVGFLDQSDTVFKSYDETIPLKHGYEVTKYGPSPINMVEIDIWIPVNDSISHIPFLKINQVKLIPSGSVEGGRCNYSSVRSVGHTSAFYGDYEEVLNLTQQVPGGDTPFEFDVPPSRPTNPQGTVGKGVLNCQIASCIRVLCTAGPFKSSQDRARVVIDASLNLTAVQMILGTPSTLSIISEGSVRITDKLPHDPQPENDRPDEDKVEMILKANLPIPPTPLPNWIIAVSAGGGFILLSVIVLLLVQLGFFRRRKHEEIQRLLQQGQVIKQAESNLDLEQELNDEISLQENDD